MDTFTKVSMFRATLKGVFNKYLANIYLIPHIVYEGTNDKNVKKKTV